MTDRANMIQEKIDDLILYICNKPTEEMTKTDYDILSAERGDIRFHRFQEQMSKKQEKDETLNHC